MGFLRIRITESPRRNILEMYLSLFTGLDFFFPLPVLGTSVHISFTFSKTILQCLSKALTLASNFLLFLQLIRTWVLFLTDWVKTDSGPVLNSSCSRWDSSSGVISLFGFANRALDKYKYKGCHKSSDKNYFMCNSFFFLTIFAKKIKHCISTGTYKDPWCRFDSISTLQSQFNQNRSMYFNRLLSYLLLYIQCEDINRSFSR